MRVCKEKVEMYWEWRVAIDFGRDSYRSYLQPEGLRNIPELITIEVIGLHYIQQRQFALEIPMRR